MSAMLECETRAAPPPDDVADRVSVYRARFHEAIDAANPKPAQRKWRVGLYERGLRLADELEARIGNLAGRRVLDVGAAHGGDVAALCARGATCVGTDKFDHGYERLTECIAADDRFGLTLSDCTSRWPFPDDSFDIVLSMSVMEIVDDLDAFFAELLRVLRPDGIAIVDTGAAVRMAHLDPLYKLPLIALLPTPLRRLVAEQVFGRKYRFHVSRHTFYTAGKFRRYVSRRGFAVEPCKYAGSPLMTRLACWPLGRLWQVLVRYVAWDFIIIRCNTAASTR